MIKKIAIGLLGLFPLLAFAITEVNPGSVSFSTVSGYNDIINLINSIANWGLGILVSLAAIFILYAAYLYMFAAGDEEKVKTARNYIIYAAIAIVVGFISKGLVGLVKTLVV